MEMDGRQGMREKGNLMRGFRKMKNGQQLGLKDSDDRDGEQMEKKADGTGKKEKRGKERARVDCHWAGSYSEVDKKEKPTHK